MRFVRAMLIWVLLPMPCVGQTISLKTEPFNESFRESANISGLIVVGVVGSGTALTKGLRVSAYVPTAWAGNDFCARVISANGLNEAQNTYSASSDWAGGVADLPFLTEHGDRWTELPRNEVGIMVTHGECSGSSEIASLAFWNIDPDVSESRATVMINSFGADQVFLFVGDDPAATAVPCQPIEGKVTTAFDLQCEVVLPKQAETQIEINRSRSGMVEPPYFITLIRQP